jgi:hypothetical protein
LQSSERRRRLPGEIFPLADAAEVPA